MCWKSSMLNDSGNSTVDCEVNGSLVLDVLISVECLIATASLFGNILVVVAVYRKKELRTNVNCFIVSMAISDLLVPLFSMPLHLNEIINRKPKWIGGPFGEFTCKFVPFAVGVSLIVSILTMIIIAAERFCCVLFPLKVVQISNKTRYRLIAVTWLVSAAVQSYFLFIRKLDAENDCIQSWEPTFNEKKARKVQIGVTFFFQYVLPFATLAMLYASITIKLYRQKTILQLSSREYKRRDIKNRKITLMAAIVACVFLIAWAPFWILVIRRIFVDNTFNADFDCSLRLAVGPVVSSYTFFNPLVYYTFNQGYRQAFNEMLCCFCPKRQTITRLLSKGRGSKKPDVVELQAMDSVRRR